MTYFSAPGDLALHGVRVLGFPTAPRVAEHYCLDAGLVEEALLDFEASGWVRQLSFAGCLARFDGYADRYSSALGKALAGQRDWVEGYDRDSCHIVWIQFHEDLLATLGIPRGTDT